MKRNSILTQSFLWATAIVACAILGAPDTVTLILLPCLAVAFLLSTLPERKKVNCRNHLERKSGLHHQQNLRE